MPISIVSRGDNDSPRCHHLDLPTSLGVNALWLNAHRRARARRYCKRLSDAGWELRAQRPRLIPRPVAVSIAAGFPKRTWEIYGLFKAACDSLEGCGVIKNDGLIHKTTARWDSDVTPAHIQIDVRGVSL